MANDPTKELDRDGGASGAPVSQVHMTDVFVAAIVIAVCVALYIHTYWFDRVPSSLAQNVQPAAFPRLVLICIMLLALMLPFEYRRKLKAGIDIDEERSDTLPPMTLATAVALLLFTVAMPTLGVLPALVLITLLLPLLWGERRWKIIIPYVLIFPISVLFLFAEILDVTFPRGLTGGIFN